LAATFVKGPFLHNVTKTSIHISWETDVPTGGRIDYRTNSDYGSQASSPESRKHHEVLLEGLRPDTVYHYQVTAGDAVSGHASFRTAVKAGTPFKFTVYGDTQALNAYHKQVVAMSHRLSPDFYMVLGDLVSEGDAEDQWQKWFDAEQIQLKKTPFFPVKGNHDGTGEVLQRYFPMMRKWFNYSFQYGNAHFVNVTVHRRGITDPELNDKLKNETNGWLETDLAAARANPEIDWIFVMRHQPYIESRLLQSWPEAFDKYHVDFVLSGDKHYYLRSVPLRQGKADPDGTMCIISGTASKRTIIKIPDQEFFDAHFDKRTNGQPAADNELHHCSFFEVDGKAVTFRDYDSETGKVYDWLRVVKDDDGKVIVRENSVAAPRAALEQKRSSD
jgi:hypothetical protein